MIAIRPASPEDEDAVWRIFREVVAGGEEFAFDPDTSQADALAFWFQPTAVVHVAEVAEQVVGSYLLKPNQPGLGGHVANAAYMVATDHRGIGIGRALAEHSLVEATRLGYRALQFNLVVSTNTAAVRLWKRLGFSIAGTLPGAFRHPSLGFVDAYVMFRSLVDGENAQDDRTTR